MLSHIRTYCNANVNTQDIHLVIFSHHNSSQLIPIYRTNAIQIVGL